MAYSRKPRRCRPRLRAEGHARSHAAGARPRRRGTGRSAKRPRPLAAPGDSPDRRSAPLVETPGRIAKPRNSRRDRGIKTSAESRKGALIHSPNVCVSGPDLSGSQICFHLHKNSGQGFAPNPERLGALPPTPPQGVAPRHARPLGCAWLRCPLRGPCSSAPRVRHVAGVQGFACPCTVLSPSRHAATPLGAVSRAVERLPRDGAGSRGRPQPRAAAGAQRRGEHGEDGAKPNPLRLTQPDPAQGKGIRNPKRSEASIGTSDPCPPARRREREGGNPSP